MAQNRKTGGTGQKSTGTRKTTTGSKSKSTQSRGASTQRKGTQTGRNTRSTAAHTRTKNEYDEQLKLRLEEDDSLRDEICVILILLCGVLFVLSYMHLCGSFGEALNRIVFGLMGVFGYAFPFALVFVSIFAIANKRNRSIVSKVIYCSLMMIFVSGLLQLAAGGFNNNITIKDFFTNSVPGFTGPDKTYGGFFGGLLCKLLCPYVGNVAAAVIMVAAVLIFFLLIAGKAIFTAIAKSSIETAEEHHRRRVEEREERENYLRENAELYDDEFPDEIPDDFFERPAKGSKSKDKKNNFVDQLMRRGMGLDIDRIADTPEYQKMMETYGKTEFDISEISDSEKKQEASDGASGEDTNKRILQSEDIVSSELNKKFGSRSSIEVPNLREHPTISKTGMTRNLMVDEEPEEIHRNDNVVPFRREEGDYTGAGANSGTKPAENPRNAETHAPITISKPAEKQEYSASATNTASENMREVEPESNESEIAGDTSRASKPAGLNTRTSSGATAFTTPEQLAELRAEQEKKQEPPYVFPPLSLLKKAQPTARTNSGKAELEATINKLQSTFESFGVGVTVSNATIGPTVTRYELLPEQGVKVKTITSLADDIKLALAAAEIRIEAPIPGKAAVGIEVPNATTSPVLLGDLLEAPEFKEAQSNLTFAVGKDIGGKTICFDIASMPHMLIAGATGSGKSVCINALILSIMYKAKPSDVRLIMIDPKRVELIGYNGIPHLLVPVVTDVKKATGALNWAIAEMDDRYERFANAGVNNLASYNRLMEEKYYEEGNEGECPDRLPQILIIVDELNDLMMTANSKEVEASICRLTQLARASGIHVVLATQRPSVNVITGTIKANIPSRIAFSVSSIVDSRTIIDQAGAEKLLGKGDMLFYPQGYPKPVRLQGAYVSDKEISSVVDFIKSKCKEVKYSDKVSQHIENNASGGAKNGNQAASQSGAGNAGDASDDGHDEFFEQAGRFIIEKQKASIGMLQRVYKIGFNRAARIMDQLADEGIVGPEEGTKPRRILMTLPQFEAYLSGEEPADAEESDEGENAPE